MNQRGIVLLSFSFALLVTGLFGFAFFVSRASCYAAWEMSGLQADWGPIKGCLVRVGGRWLPSDRLRELDLQAQPRDPAKDIPK